MSSFFAYLSRMKYIKRWGLMRNTREENVQEHSFQVAVIAHALARYRNGFLGGQLDILKVCELSLYHEACEVITGDLVTPIKYFNPSIKRAYHDIERVANEKLIMMLPEELRDDYRDLLLSGERDYPNEWRVVKAADRICAYLKCLEEQRAGNSEFDKAAKAIRSDIDALDLDEVRYFMDTFTGAFTLTLDELN